MTEKEWLEIIKNENLNDWQESLLHDAIHYEFISTNQKEEAIQIIKRFNSIDDLYETLKDSDNKVKKKLSLATQI